MLESTERWTKVLFFFGRFTAFLDDNNDTDCCQSAFNSVLCLSPHSFNEIVLHVHRTTIMLGMTFMSASKAQTPTYLQVGPSLVFVLHPSEALHFHLVHVLLSDPLPAPPTVSSVKRDWV